VCLDTIVSARVEALQSGKVKTVLRNVVEMTGDGETKAANHSVQGCQVNYTVYKLLIRINFYVPKVTVQGRKMPTAHNFRH
jgi:hypothetical protein